VRLALAGTLTFLALTACAPKNVTEAQEKGNIAWLDANGSPEAISALGLMADNNAHALDVLGARAGYDVNAYIAAWSATEREAPWGPAMLRSGLADPLRAETAAAAMVRKDGHLTLFVPDLESALMRIAASANSVAIASVLASAGPAATAAVARRLEDSATRGAMCRGIGSPDASADARRVLMTVPATSRDHASCIEAALKMAAENDAALDWLATKAEPGLLSAAGRSEEFPCPRIKSLWTSAFASRPFAAHATLTVPLMNAVARCGPQMDPVLADALGRWPVTHTLIATAIDPYGAETASLKATCTALHAVASNTSDSALVRGRASDALTHGCRGNR
jgi:hypothetical protein